MAHPIRCRCEIFKVKSIRTLTRLERSVTVATVAPMPTILGHRKE